MDLNDPKVGALVRRLFNALRDECARDPKPDPHDTIAACTLFLAEHFMALEAIGAPSYLDHADALRNILLELEPALKAERQRQGYPVKPVTGRRPSKPD